MPSSRTLRRLFLAAAMAALLVVRALVPLGWMPSAEAGHWVSLCSGAGETMAWVDGAGKIHKDKAPGKPVSHAPCAFAGLGLGFDAPADLAMAMPMPSGILGMPLWALYLAIGQGLAAPPPPKTGPPSLI
jgi:hypothetical protein